MSKSPRALEELMTAVDAGHAVDSASSDSSKLLGPRHRRSSTTNYGRGAAGARKSVPPAVAAVVRQASADASFEFSTAVNSSSASPASMVFSDGQLRAHQFPAVRGGGSSASTGSSLQVTSSSPVRVSAVGSSTKQQQQAGATGSKKRVTFATDGAAKAAGGGQGKKSGGLLGCMGCNDEAVEPVARSDNRKVVAV